MRVEIPDEIYFITFPQDVSWSKDSVNSEVATYGSNSPYLTYGTTKLRNLSLGNCLFEGFSDGKAVEGNILELEAAMQMVITEFGSASPYCWNAYAGGKSYGTFIIQSVQVQEQMRDMSGNATRATVSVSLQEVPAFQVNSGIDITANAIQGAADEKYQETLDQNAAKDQDDKVKDKKDKDKDKNGNKNGNKNDSSSSSGSGNSSDLNPDGTKKGETLIDIDTSIKPKP